MNEVAAQRRLIERWQMPHPQRDRVKDRDDQRARDEVPAAGDDRRLLTLIENSDEFDRIVRAKTFIDAFPQSLLRAKVLAMYAGEA